MTLAAAVTAAADRLESAAAELVPCAPVRDLIGADVDAAYAVQQVLVQRRIAGGARVVGRKIGLTNPRVQQQLGVDTPDFGVLFDDTADRSGDHVARLAMLQPRVEAEVAFVLAADLDEDVDVAGAVAVVVPALEIVDSRIAGWDITLADTVADNGSAGRFVLGDVRRALADVVPAEVAVTMTRDGEVVSQGVGAESLGDPLAALAWLAATARDRGDPLRAGDIVLSGALGPVVPAGAGETFRADFGPLGVVAVTFD